MTAWYNENDPFAAEWLRNLIRDGLIAPGEVDERSIVDVRADDLKGYTQCHFFAGLGAWSYALRLAGWPDDRPVWTGSCPCQPFSASGRGGGFDDDRHLWPHWFPLIDQCRPSILIGEQVASAAGLGWLDLVQTDLERAGYACGAFDICAAGVGAPHIRSRLWWIGQRLADAMRGRAGHGSRPGLGAQAAPDRGDRNLPGQRLRVGIEGAARGLVDGERPRLEGHAGDGDRGGESGRVGAPPAGSAAATGGAGGLADFDEGGRPVIAAARLHGQGPSGHDADRRGEHDGLADAEGGAGGAGLRDSGPAGERRALAADDGGDDQLADAAGSRRSGQSRRDGQADGRPAEESGRLRDTDRMADAGGAGIRDQGRGPDAGAARGAEGDGPQRQRLRDDTGDDGGIGVERLADAGRRFEPEPIDANPMPDGEQGAPGPAGQAGGCGADGPRRPMATAGPSRPGAADGFWRDADWLLCRDGKWRPVEPGTFPLAVGTPARVGRLRAYGNAIVAPLAKEFIEAVMEEIDQ